MCKIPTAKRRSISLMQLSKYCKNYLFMNYQKLLVAFLFISLCSAETVSTGGAGGTATTPCSQLGQACASTADCCSGQCLNYECSTQETTGSVTRVDILAPASALLNDIVIVKMVDENNQAVAGGTVLIVSPTKESMVILTDSNGEAEFNATYEGLYTYNAPAHYLLTIRATNVLKPTAQTLTPPTQQPQEQQAPPSVAMALAAYAPWMLGLLLLFLIAFFLAKRKKNKKLGKWKK